MLTELLQEISAPVGHMAFKLKWLLYLPYESLVPSHLSCHLRQEGQQQHLDGCVDGLLYTLLQGPRRWNETPAQPCQQPVIPVCIPLSRTVPCVTAWGGSATVILSRCPSEYCTCPKPHFWEGARPDLKLSCLPSRETLLFNSKTLTHFP